MYYLLFYEKAADHEQRQLPVQDAHREHVLAAAELVLAGSMTNPDNGASLLVFSSDSPATAEAFAKADPYVKSGVVSHWHIRAWDIVVDKLAR